MEIGQQRYDHWVMYRDAIHPSWVDPLFWQAVSQMVVLYEREKIRLAKKREHKRQESARNGKEDPRPATDDSLL